MNIFICVMFFVFYDFTNAISIGSQNFVSSKGDDRCVERGRYDDLKETLNQERLDKNKLEDILLHYVRGINAQTINQNKCDSTILYDHLLLEFSEERKERKQLEQVVYSLQSRFNDTTVSITQQSKNRTAGYDLNQNRKFQVLLNMTLAMKNELEGVKERLSRIGQVKCNTRPCIHGYCHSTKFAEGGSKLCICHPGFTGDECDTKHTCTQPTISLAGKCYDLLNNVFFDPKYQHVSELNYEGTVYPLNKDCLISTSTNPFVRGVYCHCGQQEALLFSNHSLSMCGCEGGKMRKLDGTCTDMNLCMLTDYCVHGICLNTTLVPACVCDAGFTGSRCDTKISNPSIKYCNGKRCDYGVCADTFCMCEMGWIGEHCDTLQHCDNGYSLMGVCRTYDKQPFNEKCHDSSVCPTCFLYPFSKAGVICGIEGDKYRLLDGTLVPIIDVQHITAGGCFPPNSIVIGKQNKTIKMELLKIGEEILTVDDKGNYAFTKVILMMHNDRQGKLRYRKLMTDIGILEISPEHLIYTLDDRGNVIVKAAGRIKIGDSIFSFNKYLGRRQIVRVLQITEESKAGMYAPLTVSGNLVVDNHFVSSYATYENQDLVHLLFWPWRVVHKVSSWIFGEETYAPKENRAHWSLKGFFMFANLRCYLFNEEYCEYMNF